MIEDLLQHMEDNATRQLRTTISKAKDQQLLNIAHYLFQITTVAISFIVVLISLSLASKHNSYRALIICCSVVFLFFLIVSSQFLKRNPSFLNLLKNCYTKLKTTREQKKYFNLFHSERIALLLTIYFPLFLFFLLILFNRTIWIKPHSERHALKLDIIKQIISFSLAVMTIQTALFAFLLGQLLGKYSPKIAKVLIKNPALILTLFYPLISLVLLWISVIYGYPQVVDNIIGPWFVFSNVLCLIFTIIISFKGIHPDLVVTYAGTSFSHTIQKSFKPAIYLQKDKPFHFWNFMRYLGLDWRSTDRLRINEPPPSITRLLNEQLTSLFNTANKAIQENHEELLQASLVSILRIVQIYTKIRASYYGSGDTVHDYARNQMSALLKASSKSLNEYMIEQVVKAIGFIGRICLEIKRSPVGPPTQTPFTPSHQLAMFWSGLLIEAFDLSHLLMNSTAANKTISELQSIAVEAIHRKEYNTINISFLSRIQYIHQKCYGNPDAYHQVLAGDCLHSVINIWGFTCFKLASDPNSSFLYDLFIKSVEQMVTKQYVLDQVPTFRLDGKTSNILTLKYDNNHLILQDIFYLTLSRKSTESWHLDSKVRRLEEIIQLLEKLAENSLRNKETDSGQYATAFYEICYLVLRGLPEEYQASKQKNSILHNVSIADSYQQILEKKVFDAWSKLFLLFYKSESYMVWEWEQNFFAIIGLGIAIYKKRQDDKLKLEIIRCIKEFKNILTTKTTEKIRDHWWDYYQLVGAWTYYLLEEKALGEDIAKTVGELRPFEFHGNSTDGRYGYLGYPTISYMDFFLPALDNLVPQGYITDDDRAQFKTWRDILINDDVLVGYYEIVEKTREPLRKQFYEQIRKHKKMNNNNFYPA